MQIRGLFREERVTIVAAKVGLFGTRIIGGVGKIIKMERYEPRRVLNPRARLIGIWKGWCGAWDMWSSCSHCGGDTNSRGDGDTSTLGMALK
jgi:hypothetical protein